MPKPVVRVTTGVGALIAALLMTCLGAGAATADPDDSGGSTDPGTGGAAPPVSEPEPTTGLPPATTPEIRAPSIFDIPQTIATQLRDMFGKPLSVFGNGRVPGTLTLPDGTAGSASTGHKRDRPSTGTLDTRPDPPPPEADSPEPARRSGSTVEVALPFTPPISVPVPSLPVPGYTDLRWSLNLTDPYAAYTAVGQTLNTVNSLLRDAYAPYDPFRQPAPAPTPTPTPTFRIMQEEPSVVDADPTDAVPLSTGSSSGLPVLQAPVVIPQIRPAPPRPIGGAPPADARVPAAGSAGARAPAVKGPVTQTGSTPAEQLPAAAPGSPSASAMGAPARAGYPRYLRSARPNEMAVVAVPGVAGLLALTFGGGVIGYRQANSGRFLRTGAARFLA